ncbi:MAG: methylenetetrahydrofolate reductase [Clostridia bacterium]|nr:methylenetetrahydrofolate reductase [Clostridia bacterium]
MFIADLLREKPVTVSCELFPPKCGTAFDNAPEVVERTVALQPDFISVTCSAKAAGNNVEMASHVRACGATPLAHLTCVGASKAGIDEMLDTLTLRRIHNLLALRGDIPADGPAERGYTYASELVSHIKARGDFSVGAACYPEGHVESAGLEQDLVHLRAKVDAGADFLITQMFFDNNILYRFLYKALAHGVNVPVLAGVMPVTNRSQIERILKLSGTTLPPRFLNILDRFGDSPIAMRQAGVAYATEQIIDLIANGVRGVHIYTMNHPEIAGEIMHNIRYIVEAGCEAQHVQRNVG